MVLDPAEAVRLSDGPPESSSATAAPRQSPIDRLRGRVLLAEDGQESREAVELARSQPTSS